MQQPSTPHTGGSWKRALSYLDAYPKVSEDFYSKTVGGGVITIVSSVIMVLLFLNELSIYMSVQTMHELTVDKEFNSSIAINVSPECSLLIPARL